MITPFLAVACFVGGFVCGLGVALATLVFLLRGVAAEAADDVCDELLDRKLPLGLTLEDGTSFAKGVTIATLLHELQGRAERQVIHG